MNRADSVQQSIARTWWITGSALASLFGCLLDSGIACALTKEQAAEIYKDKLGRFSSYRIKYTQHMTYNDGERTADWWDLYEYSGSGNLRALSQTIYHPEDDSTHLARRQIHNGELWKVIVMEEDKAEAFGGRVKYLTNNLKTDFGATSFLGYFLLYDMEWDGDPLSMMSGTQEVDGTVLFRDSRTTILPESQALNGHDCFVVEYGSDPKEPFARYWFAGDMNLALVRRETFSGRGNARFVQQRVEFSDFHEVEPGLFIANALNLEYFGPKSGPLADKTASGAIALLNHMTFQVTSLELDCQFEEGHFDLEFPAGTIVTDEVIRETYVVDAVAKSLQESMLNEINNYDLKLDSIFQGGGASSDTSIRSPESVSPQVEKGSGASRRRNALAIWMRVGTGVLLVTVTIGAAIIGRAFLARR